MHGPRVEYAKPLTDGQVEEHMKIRKALLTNCKRKALPEHTEIVTYMADCNTRVVQDLNQWAYFSKACDRAALFGAGARPYRPERSMCSDGKLHYDVYLQQAAKYKTEPQRAFETPNLQGMEQDLKCCNSVFRFMAPLTRHLNLCHGGLKPATKRKRGQPVPFRRRVRPRKSQRAEVPAPSHHPLTPSRP